MAQLCPHTCPGCSAEFEAVAANARWCSDRCRHRGNNAAGRQRTAERKQAKPAPAPRDPTRQERAAALMTLEVPPTTDTFTLSESRRIRGYAYASSGHTHLTAAC